MIARCLAALGVAALMLVAGCGAGGGRGSVRIDPPSVTVSAGSTYSFSVTVKECDGTSVRWSVQEPDGGTIDDDGVYHAPGYPGTYHVVAQCDKDSSVSDTATVYVN